MGCGAHVSPSVTSYAKPARPSHKHPHIVDASFVIHVVRTRQKDPMLLKAVWDWVENENAEPLLKLVAAEFQAYSRRIHRAVFCFEGWIPPQVHLQTGAPTGAPLKHAVVKRAAGPSSGSLVGPSSL